MQLPVYSKKVKTYRLFVENFVIKNFSNITLKKIGLIQFKRIISNISGLFFDFSLAEKADDIENTTRHQLPNFRPVSYC